MVLPGVWSWNLAIFIFLFSDCAASVSIKCDRLKKPYFLFDVSISKFL